jgi:hypothetical protein
VIQALWREKNKDRVSSYKAEWHLQNKERMNAASRAWGQANAVQNNAKAREKYINDPEYYKQRAKAYAAANPERVSFSAIKRLYGMSQEEYGSLLESQGGACAICCGPPTGRGKKSGRYYVDHDHDTGVVRGLLCHGCNIGIGHLKDSSELLMKASKYLKKAGK